MTLADSGNDLRKLDTVLLKVASRCNLDCGYCYVYHMGDEAWRDQPKLMSQRVVYKVAEALGAQYRHQQTPFSVVLHGGEPLMLGAARLDALCKALRSALPHPCGLHVQTNGLLLTDEIIDVLVAYDVGISVSIDGPADVHDRFRVDHRDRGSHARVAQGIARVTARTDARPLFAGVLAVIDPTSDPADVYAELKATGSPSIDVLVRDGNWHRLPFGKASPGSTEYGDWLSRMLGVYLTDPTPPRVRLLDDMMRLLLGGSAQKEGVGTTDYGILVIEPDGRIDKNDTLKVAHAAADQFDRPWSILRDALETFLDSPAYNRYYSQQNDLSPTCLSCPDLTVCGGGMVAHRWSETSGFDNPTIFCADQRRLIANMRGVLAQISAKAA
ncbi:cyclophane-forming radical SAM/SPASM peptide maturase YhhB [Sphingobium sp. JAI105]|uniref:cyclophane-forming radical SAM/SPASM peptide maturase YhhB n=1 Tax=Sphingobium sp. JAI105 TaxID=2787715 RepID=UPI002F2B7AB1